MPDFDSCFAEISGDYGEVGTIRFLKDFHRRRLQVLAEAGPDLIAFETIPNKLEAQVYYFVILIFCLALYTHPCQVSDRWLVLSFRHMLNFLRNVTYISLHGFPSTQKMELIL